MSIETYSCKAIETGSGEIRTGTSNVGAVAQLGQLRITLTPAQMAEQSVLVALAMLLDNKVSVSHHNGDIVTTFFRG